MKYQALRLFLWRWHRRLGLSAAILLIWLSVSGVMLNHTSSLDLASIKLPVSLANAVYPVDYIKGRTLDTGLGRVEQLDQNLRIKGQSIQSCDGLFIGAIMVDQELWLACENQLLVLTEDAELLESMDKYSGLQTPIDRIGDCANSICIESNQLVSRVDIATVSWYPYEGVVNWVSATLSDQQVPQLMPEIHNLERLILEAHSGRLFGASGVLIMDLAAIAMILLALSGCYVWWSHYRRRRIAVKRASRAVN